MKQGVGIETDSSTQEENISQMSVEKKQEEMMANSPIFPYSFFFLLPHALFACLPFLFLCSFLLLLLNNTDALYKSLSCYHTQAPSPLTLQMSF